MKYLKTYENIDWNDWDDEEELGFSDLIGKENVYITISSKDNYLKLMRMLEDIGVVWYSRTKPTDINLYNKDDDYAIEITKDKKMRYGRKSFYIERWHCKKEDFIKDTDIL